MEKTGEAYTTARLHLVRTPDYATLAGMSDEKVEKATGCNWEKWVFVLDRADAKSMSHRELAQYISDKYDTPGWWTQMVAVGYERIRGLRAMGQRRSGEWEVSKSKTVPVPVKKLFAAFKTARGRAKWLDAKPEVRTANPDKTIRLRWEDGTPVDVYFLPQGAAKCRVAIQHRKLRSKEEADKMRAFWAERLDALAAATK